MLNQKVQTRGRHKEQTSWKVALKKALAKCDAGKYNERKQEQQMTTTPTSVREATEVLLK